MLAGENIERITALKTLILDQVQAHEGHTYPGCTFSVVTTLCDRWDCGMPNGAYRARVILYEDPNRDRGWKLVWEGGVGSSTEEAMELLYQDYQIELGRLTLHKIYRNRKSI